MAMALLGFMYHKVTQQQHMRVAVQQTDSTKPHTEIMRFRRIKKNLLFTYHTQTEFNLLLMPHYFMMTQKISAGCNSKTRCVFKHFGP